MFKFVGVSLLIATSLGLSARERAEHVKTGLSLIEESLATISEPDPARDVALNALLRNVAAASEDPDSPEKKMKDALARVMGFMKTILDEAKKMAASDQKYMDAQKGNFEKCGSDAAWSKVLEKEEQELDIRITYETCRNDEAFKLNEAKAHCGHAALTLYQIFTEGICFWPLGYAPDASNLADLLDETVIDVWILAMKQTQAKALSWQQRWGDNVQPCADELVTLITNHTICDNTMIGWESHVCAWETAHFDFCSDWYNCHLTEAQRLQSAITELQQYETNRVNLARVMDQTMCFIQLLMDFEEFRLPADWKARCPDKGEDSPFFFDFKIEYPEIAAWPGCSAEATHKEIQLKHDDYDVRYAIGGPWSSIKPDKNYVCDKTYDYPEFWAVANA